MAARSSMRTDGQPGWRLPTVTTGSLGTGSGGNLAIVAGRVEVSGGGSIDSSSVSFGHGGDVFVRAGDEVQVRSKSREMTVIKNSLEARKGQGVPDWLEIHADRLVGRVLHIPTRASIGVPINEQLIVELYSK